MQHLAELLASYSPTHSLRSSDQHLLVILKTNLETFEDISFEVAAPRLWNAAPQDRRCATSIVSFNHNLKTYLFKQTFHL